MNKKISLSIVILLICIAFAFYIGTWFSGKNSVPSDFKHKYDSATAIIKAQHTLMLTNQKTKDSLRLKEKDLKFKQDSTAEEGHRQKAFLAAKRKELVVKWTNSNEKTIGEEMTKRFKDSHPAPLFDSSVGPDVVIGKNVSIHFLDRDEEATGLTVDLKTTEAQLSLSLSRITNLLELGDKAKLDSAAQQTIIDTQADVISNKDKEALEVKKQAKKDLNKQKLQKWVATGVAAIMTYLAIHASQ